jgi:hypothetical protein
MYYNALWDDRAPSDKSGNYNYSYDWEAGVYTNYGEKVTYDEVFNNYILPNSITYNGQEARNFVGLLNTLGQYSVEVNNNQVIVNYIPSSDLLASNSSSCPPSNPLLRTGSQSFFGTIGAFTLEDGAVMGNDVLAGGLFSGGYYSGIISLDAIFNLTDNAFAGYDLLVSASVYSASGEFTGNVSVMNDGKNNWYPLSESSGDQLYPNTGGYHFLGQLNYSVKPDSYYLSVKVTITNVLDVPTFNLNTYASFIYNF